MLAGRAHLFLFDDRAHFVERVALPASNENVTMACNGSSFVLVWGGTVLGAPQSRP